MNDEEVCIEFYRAIQYGKLAEIQRMYDQFPIVREHNFMGLSNREPWVDVATKKKAFEALKLLLSLGYDINAMRLPESQTALISSIEHDLVEFFDFLLSHGASPDIGRPLIGAMSNRLPLDRRYYYANKLIQHGVDVNRLYAIYGDQNNTFSALDWVKDDDIRELLLENGALPSRVIKERIEAVGSVGSKIYGDAVRTVSAPRNSGPITSEQIADKVISFFQNKFGPVDSRSIIEVVPSSHNVTIHAIRPTTVNGYLTLFTTGMSSRPMQAAPNDESASRYAELFIQLPGTWDFTKFKDSSLNWPLKWLRKLAKYPAANNCWLQYPLTVMSSEDSGPIAPNLEFDSFLLLAENEIELPKGEELHLYRVFPLYPEERVLEQNKGAPALMRGFDKYNISFITDTSRINTAL